MHKSRTKVCSGQEKKILLLRMIPPEEEFNEMAADVLFNQNMLTLEWISGTSMPKMLADRIAEAVRAVYFTGNLDSISRLSSMNSIHRRHCGGLNSISEI